MIKKVILIVICIIFAFALCVSASGADAGTSEENPAAATAAPATEPNGDLPERRQGNMAPPQDGIESENGSRENMQPPEGGGDPGANDGGGRGGAIPENGQYSGESVSQQTEETISNISADAVIGFAKTYSTPIISMFMLGAAFVFVIFYKRKRF